MKKTIALVAASAALSLAAAWERAASVRVAGPADLSKAVSLVGEMTGNQMVGTMLAANVTQLPGHAFFGPMREGGAMSLLVFVDSSKAAAKVEDLEGSVDFTVAYPMALPEDEFLKLHPRAAQTNGMVAVKCGVFDEPGEDEDDITYVAFSEDGKWAVAGEIPELVRQSLKDLPAFAKPMKGDVARVQMSRKAINVVEMLVSANAAKSDKASDKAGSAQALQLLGSVSSLSMSLRVARNGIDLRSSSKVMKGSAMESAGLVALGPDPFADVGGDAVFAGATSLFDESDRAAVWDKFRAVMSKHGLSPDKWLKVSCTDKSESYEFDAAKFVSSVMGPETNRLACLDKEKFAEDLQACVPPASSPKAASGAYVSSMSLAGVKPKVSVSRRFANVFPEAKGKKTCYAFVFSLAGFVKPLFAAVLESIPEKDRAQAAPMLALMPSEPDGGFAMMSWRDKDSIRSIARISADELKGIATFATAVAISAASGGRVAPAAEDSSGDDDDDDDD